MEASLTLIIRILLFFLITYSKAYDNLLEDRSAVIFLDGGRETKLKGKEDTIDGNTSTCLDISRFDEEVRWVVNFTAVQSVYKIIVYLASSYTDKIKLSVFVSNSSSVEAGSLCASASMIVEYNKSSILERKCTNHGRFVMLRFSMRNRRVYGLSICDVSITGCNNGIYGKNCSRNCSVNCVGKSCDILEGRCLSGTCSDGWQGDDCNQKCYNGTYGPRCKSPCGNCRGMQDCDHMTGYCKEGCIDGWKGDKCDEVCLDGTYGSNCENICGKCRGVTDCDKQSGVCLNGCENGYFGEKCNSKCSDGTYGNQCNFSCGNCKDLKDCDHETGYCEGGCANGWKGDKCEEVCPFGFYGNQCAERCNISCDPETGQQKISGEGSTSTLNAEENNITTVYALGAALTVSFLINVMLVAMGIMRFRITRKDEINGKPSPVYVNVNNGRSKDNQPFEGEQMDQQNVQYEALGVPSNETHYDALQ